MVCQLSGWTSRVNPGVAMTFAIGYGSNGFGRVGVVPTEVFREGISIVELRDHGWAVRAQRQDGFAVARMAPPILDLKSRWAQTRLGIKWYEFPITAQDRQQSLERYDKLVSLEDDPTAGLLRHEVIQYVEAFGKLPGDLVTWILERIPIVPRAGRVTGFSHHETLVDHVTPGEIQFDPKAERDQTLRYLSRDHSDDSRERSQGWVRVEVGNVVADPRTLHQLISHPKTSVCMKALSFWKAVTMDKSNLLNDVFALLHERGVRFCVIGGQAVNAYVEPLVRSVLISTLL